MPKAGGRLEASLISRFGVQGLLASSKAELLACFGLHILFSYKLFWGRGRGGAGYANGDFRV